MTSALIGILMRVLGVAAVIAALAGGIYAIEQHGETLGARKVQARWDADTANRDKIATQETSKQAAKEATWNANKEAIEHEHQAALQSARDDADRASRNADSLRKQLAAIAARSRQASSDPQAVAAGPSTEGSVVVLADMLARVVDRTTELARFADESRLAGLACERSYDSLTGEDHGDQEKGE